MGGEALPAPASRREHRAASRRGAGFDHGHRRQRQPTSWSRAVPDPQNLASPPTPASATAATRVVDTEPTPADTAVADAVVPPAAHADAVARSATPIAATRSACRTATSSRSRASRSRDPASMTAADIVADASGGIAVLVTDGAFTRGTLLRITGEIDDRFAQRTLRAEVRPSSSARRRDRARGPRRPGDGAVGEDDRGELVRVRRDDRRRRDRPDHGRRLRRRRRIRADRGWSSPPESGIDITRLEGRRRDRAQRGRRPARLVRHAARRLSRACRATRPTSMRSSSGIAPPAPPRVGPARRPSARRVAAPGGRADASRARGPCPKNARARVRGVVTLPPGVVDAVDRGHPGRDRRDRAAPRRRGRPADPRASLLEVAGTRSTKSGMETLRVTQPATDRRIGQPPTPARVPAHRERG